MAVEAQLRPGGDQPCGPAPDARRAWLEHHRLGAVAERDRHAAVESRWSWLRLLFFFGALVVWFPLGAYPWAAGALMVGGLVLFGAAVRRHQSSRAEREFADRLLAVTDESLARCGGHVVAIRSPEAPRGDSSSLRLEPLLDDGPTWELTDQERDDLDVYARPVGLFGLLNRASTRLGERRLDDRLNRPMLSARHIVARQRTVDWLRAHPAERLRLLAAAAGLRKEDRRFEGFVSAVSNAGPLRMPLPGGLILAWSYVTLGVVAATAVLIVIGQYSWGWALAPLLALNTLIYVRLAGPVHAVLGPWRDVAWGARGYLAVARQAARDLPESGELGALRERLAAVTDPGVLPAICARLGWTESGGLVGLLVNVVAFSDLRVARSLLARVVPHREALRSGATALADLETLLSLACFAYEQPHVCWPAPEAGAALAIRGGRHPLVAPDRIVPNDVALDEKRRIWIVTGSNMAGKSTLLRMIGTNLLLAQMGGAVAAERFTWRPLRLMTDLRARDNLAASESYFLSEVRHLRRMVLPPPGEAPILGLIDEPFRGTNSHDQTAASRAVVLHLRKTGNLFLVATHDRWLTELADGESIWNYHFRENLSTDGDGVAGQGTARMVFDYRLHEGPATTRNALLVLEREGYPKDLLTEARTWEGDGERATDPNAGPARSGSALGKAAES